MSNRGVARRHEEADARLGASLDFDRLVAAGKQPPGMTKGEYADAAWRYYMTGVAKPKLTPR